MKLFSICAILCPLIFFSCKQDPKKPEQVEIKVAVTYDNPGHALVAKMVEKTGSMEDLKAFKDVEFTYTYDDKANNLKDISTERYVFEGEKSWARYDHHKKFVNPKQEGTVVQGYDGNLSWTTLDDKKLEDPDVNKTANFLRKTNYYWFTMMPKLMDPGVKYTQMEDRLVEGKNYNIVKISYDENIGDVQDEYLLYINPETSLVDQFLFTVMDFGLSDPLLMKVKYQEVNDLILPSKRTYTQSDWQGNIKGKDWVDQTFENVKFNNGFDESLFKLNL